MSTILKVKGTRAAIWEKPETGDPDAPFDDPAAHLELIRFCSDFNYLTFAHVYDVTVSHAAVAGSTATGYPGVPAGDGSIGGTQPIRDGQVVTTNHTLVTHNLGSAPLYMVIYDGQIVSGAQAVQVESGDRQRVVSSFATSSVIGLREIAFSFTSGLSATSRNYRVIVFNPPEPDPLKPLFHVKLRSGTILMGQGKIEEGMATVRRTRPGDGDLYLPLARTLDAANGAFRSVSPTGLKDVGGLYNGNLFDAPMIDIAFDPPSPVDPDSPRVFTTTSDRFYFEADGVPVFDSEVYPVGFLPQSDWIEVTGQTLSFPDLLKGDVYGYARGTIGVSLQCSCASYIALKPQEWGPEEVNPLPATTLGTVPAGTDILLVYARVTRTSAPSQIKGQNVPVLPREGEWVFCPGGCLPLEYTAPLARMMEVRLEGTTITLRRKQSVSNKNYSYFRTDNSPENSGWTYGGGIKNVHAVYHLESKGPVASFGNSLKRYDSSRCSLTDITNYGSTYSVDIRVIPGRSGIDPEELRSNVGYLGTFNDTNSTQSHTFTVPFGPAPATGHTRRVFVCVKNAVTSAPGITSVSIGGAAATQHVSLRTSPQAAIYSREVNAGDSGSVVVSTAPNNSRIQIDVLSAYDMESAVAHATAESSSTSPQTIATLDGGFVIGSQMAHRGPFGDQNTYPMTGVETSVSVGPNYTSSVDTDEGFLAFQDTDGSTLTVSTARDSGAQFVRVLASFR